MSAESNRVQAVFLAAVECSDVAERERLVEEQCAAQPEVKARVKALLNAHDKAGTLPSDPTASFKSAAPTVGSRR